MADIEDIIRGAEGRWMEDRQSSIICFAVKCEHPGCDHELLVPRPKIKISKRDRAGQEPVYIHTIEHAMAAADWTFRRNRARPLCAEHHPRITHAPVTPKEPALPIDPRHNGATPLPGPTLAPQPTPAREPTRADNQRIHEELAVAYDDVGFRYKGDCSDEKVARKLDVPRAWVSTIRKGFFGEHDRNEAAEDDKAIAAAMDLLAEADKKAATAKASANAAVTVAAECAADVSRARSMLDGIRRAR